MLSFRGHLLYLWVPFDIKVYLYFVKIYNEFRGFLDRKAIPLNLLLDETLF